VPQTSVSSPRAAQQPFSCTRTTSTDATATRLAPRGELDVATAPALKAALWGAQVFAQLVVVDLAGVDFIDSAGVHVLVDATETAALRHRRLMILHSSDMVRRVFALTDTRRLLDVMDPASAGPMAVEVSDHA